MNTSRWARLAAVLSATVALIAAANTLDIYFIDVEGGQATLIVTPAGQSILVDAGFPGGSGGFDGMPGEPRLARDANRILGAAKDADVKAIDYMIVTHFHADHDGGIPELAQLLPIRTFVDHDRPLPAVESVAGSLAAFDRYAAVRAKGRHIVVKPGDHLPLKGAEVTFVASAGATITKALGGAGNVNPACAATPGEAQEKHENPRSTAFLLRFGKFRFLDVGDLSGKPLFDLACPKDLIGPVAAYLVAHHGGVDAADPATFAAFRPRVAVLNNGPAKGGAPEAFATLHRASSTDTWQLHHSQIPGAENFADERIANVDATTAHWIRVRANQDGSFDVINGRTGGAWKY